MKRQSKQRQFESDISLALLHPGAEEVLAGIDDPPLRMALTPDPRAAEAIDLLVSKRDSSGRWALDVRYPGTMPLKIDAGVGEPSRWNTLRALRVLRWYAEGAG